MSLFDKLFWTGPNLIGEVHRHQDESRRLYAEAGEPELPGWTAKVLDFPGPHAPFGDWVRLFRAIAAIDARLSELENERSG